MSDVGDVARAVEIIGKIVFAELHPSQQDQIIKAYGYSEKRIAEFKDALLADQYLTCGLLFDGCLPSVPARVSAEERIKLEEPVLDDPNLQLTKYQWLGEFCAAESANFERRVVEIIRTTTKDE